MRLSKSTILAPIPGRDEVLAVNPLSGQAAVLEAAVARKLREGDEPDPSLPLEALQQAGFVVESEHQERAMLAEAYASFLEELDRTPTQLIVVPTFGCNLRCTYCYQDTFDPGGRGLIAPELIAGLFRYIDQFHGGDARRPYLTLFGGEPLVDAPAYHERIGLLLAGARARQLPVAVVTNGYHLEAFAPLLGRERVREVQVTIDGPARIHDARRPHASGAGTFERVVRGVDALIAAGVPVNLRMVADRQNLETLPELAALAEERGWLELPADRFKTQVGRNYELFGCASRQKHEDLFSRVELWRRFVELAEAHPVVRRFHQPRFHGMRHLAETGELPAANFDACPAAKREWAFGPDGGLYGCTATVGNPRYRLGSFAPEVSRDEKAIALWAGRNVFSIPACAGCSLAPVCGGGCGAIAAQASGDVRSPDCRPVEELFGLGARFYGLGTS